MPLLLKNAIRIAYHTPSLRPFLLEALKEAQESYLSEGTVFRPMQKTTFWYRHERLHPKQGKEPAGAYVVATSEDQADGKVTVRRPLFLQWGSYRGPGGWVSHLVDQYGATRKNLTRKLRKERIDAIVTIRRNKTYQIVLLNVPLSKDGVDAKRIQMASAREKRQRFFRPPTNYSLENKNFEDDTEDSTEDFEGKVRKILGPTATTKDLIALSGFEGLPSEGEYQVSILHMNSTGFILQVEGTGIHTLRRVVKIRGGKIVLNNSSLFLEDNAPPGLGTRIFYAQALAAQSLGIESIQCKAIRSAFSIGYYVWARLGYNAKLSYIFIARAHSYELRTKWAQLQRILSDYPDPSQCTVHDLMMAPGGREWWRENGIPWKATFDLSPTQDGGPSPSMQVLETYVREKESVLGKPVGKWAYPIGDNVYLSPQDDEILDWVWDVMRERFERLGEGQWT